MLNWLKNMFSKQASPPNPTFTVDYLLNDPMTPNLTEQMTVPINPTDPKFVVAGWNGVVVSDSQKQAAQVFACIQISNNMVKQQLQRPFTHWAAVDTLVAVPVAFRNFNAFYDRAALQFGVAMHPITKKQVFTCMSPNIVAHEHGHAVLDALRPDLWNTQSLEIFAFHEFYGDAMSILNGLQSSRLIQFVLQETNNDLRKSNVVSRIAEEMGNALYNSGYRIVQIDALRNAVNDLKYAPPETLPPNVKDLSLCQEPHNFSRVFTGAWYDCLVSIYEQERRSKDPAVALASARDTMTRLTLNAVPLAAANPRFYASFAKAMITMSMSICPDYTSLIRGVFIDRRILSLILLASNRKFIDLNDPKLDASRIFKVGDHMIVRDGDKSHGRLIDHSGKLKLSHLPVQLLKAKIEMPRERYMVVDGISRVIDDMPYDEDAVFDSAHAAVSYLHGQDQIDNDPLNLTKGFSVIDGKLVRKRSCLDI